MAKRRTIVPPAVIAAVRLSLAALVLWLAYTAGPTLMSFLADPRLLYVVLAAAAVVGLALLWRLVVRARRRRSWNGPVSTLIFPPEPKVPAAGRAR